MADQQDKTEQATPHKLQEARKKGQVARSMELNSLAMLLTFTLVLLVIASKVANTLALQTQWWLGHADQLAESWHTLIRFGQQSLTAIFFELIPLFLGLIVIAIFINLSFNGFVFSMTPLKPDLKRLNPVTGLKKIFSKKMLVELIKVIVKGILFSCILYFIFESHLHRLLGFSSLYPSSLPNELLRLTILILFAMIAVMLFSALFDMWYSKKEFSHQMKMSHRDIKDEYKQKEGSPEVKNKRRQLQQEFLSKVKALSQVKNADVIITNPTHFAVALQYRPHHMNAPKIVAVGKHGLAHLIMRLGRRHRVPILRQPALARQLYKDGALNATIPPESQLAVVSVYQWVLSLPNHQVKF